MRVVAGSAKGHRLVAPDGMVTRPTSDRVREAIFNTLYSVRALEGADVVDLFAGSGALGIEALSRGAARVTFVDHDRNAVAAIKRNVTATGFDARAMVVHADATAYAIDAPDVVFVDPPYAFAGWPALLARLDRAALVVAESDRPIDPPEGGEVLKSKHYGSTVVTLISTTRSRP